MIKDPFNYSPCPSLESIKDAPATNSEGLQIGPNCSAVFTNKGDHIELEMHSQMNDAKCHVRS